MKQTFRFGKKFPKVDDRTLKFKSYLTPALPPPPVTYSSLTRVMGNFKAHGISQLFPMDGNDKRGDCTIAGAAHATTVFAALINKLYVMDEADVISTYLRLGDGEDNGLAMLDVLKYWRKTGIGGHKIQAFVSVDPTHQDDIKQAIYLFGAVYIGFAVQENAISDFRNHKMWQPGRKDGGGHCVDGTAYGVNGLTVLTWGSIQDGSWDWLAQMGDECYAVLPAEAKIPGFAPGFNFAQLTADLQAITA